MKRKYKITDWIFIALLILLAAAMALVWPLGGIAVKKTFSTLEAGAVQSGEITEKTPLAGIFQPAASRLSSIGIKFYIPERADNPGYLVFQLSDGAGNGIYSETVYFSEMQNNRYYEFKVNRKLDPAAAYIYQVEARGYAGNPPKAYLASLQTAAPGQADAYYAGARLPGTTPLVRFTYYGRAGFTEALPYLITLCGAAILLLAAWRHPFFREEGSNA